MNYYELGKDIQTLVSTAASIDKRLSAAATSAISPDRVDDTVDLSGLPCRHMIAAYDDFSFTTTLHALTLISQTARGNDYLAAMTSEIELEDADGNSLGKNVYLARSGLQGMIQLADNLHSHVDKQRATVGLSYGVFDYKTGPNPPGKIPLLWGVRAAWTPLSTDFGKAGQGLLIHLEAELVESGNACGLRILAKAKETFNGREIVFRAGPEFTQQKLDALAAAYFRACYAKKGFQELGLKEVRPGDFVLARMQWME